MSHKADELLKEELQVLRLIQFVRFAEKAFVNLLSQEQIRDIKRETKFKVLAFA